MPGKAVGRAAVDLPWLCPNTDSLVGLAERPADLARVVDADPALLAFLLRAGPADPRASSFSFAADRFHSAAILDTAAAYLDAAPASWIDPTGRAFRRVRALAATAARYARAIAEHTARASPVAAGVAALIAPLGWYAVVAVDAVAADRALADPALAGDPAAVQSRLWELDHDAVARRLARRWRWPAWAAMIPGSLNLPFRVAGDLLPEPDLFAVVQLAVYEAETRTNTLGLTRTADRDDLIARLGLDAGDLDRLCDRPLVEASVPQPDYPPNPHQAPLVRNLLLATAAARRRAGSALVLGLEQRVDELLVRLGELSNESVGRLRDAKLDALAELAAGAGHEINNPLAVISGNAQLLVRTEPDAERAETLRTIVRQTHRIAGILRDLMQFARPGTPEPGRFSAAELLAAVRTDLDPLARERRVRLELTTAPAGVFLDADFRQVRHAVHAVVRNGIEAAPAGGWVRFGCECGGGAVRFVVEDSGPGLTAEAADHAFDPFFCGRPAGRGRGLGLSTAWQFARRNGGDVRHEPTAAGVTRFVVSAPRSAGGGEVSERQSA